MLSLCNCDVGRLFSEVLANCSFCILFSSSRIKTICFDTFQWVLHVCDMWTCVFTRVCFFPFRSVGCCLDVPEYPFDEQYDSFAFNSLLTLPESIQAITKVRTECNRVSHTMSLYHIPTAKPMRLEEFEQAQSQATSQVPGEHSRYSAVFVCVFHLANGHRDTVRPVCYKSSLKIRQK